MTTHDELPRDLVWEGAHLTEVAITALADGEDAIIPADAHAHVAGCDACARQLGQAAMLSTALGRALREMPARREVSSPAPAPAPDAVTPEARVPWRALAAGLLFAMLGAVPMLLRADSFFAYARFMASRGTPILVHAFAAVLGELGGPQRVIATATITSAVVLVCAAAFVVRKALPSKNDVGSEGVTR